MSQFAIKAETRARCRIVSLNDEMRKKFVPISMELYGYLFEVKSLDMPLFIRIGRQMVEYMKPSEYSRDYLEHMWKATQKKGADAEICVLRKDHPKLEAIMDYVRGQKLDRLIRIDPSLDRKTLAVFSNLSGASQMIIKGGIDQEVAKRATAAASYMVTNLMNSEAAMGTLSRMILIDPTLYDHSAAVAMFSSLMASKYQHDSLVIGPKDLNTIAQCGLYHDTGKTCVPSHILNKPSSFTEEEYNIIKTHAEKGYEELLAARAEGAPLAEEVLRVALEHHERMAGTGYPHGKKGRYEDDPEHGIHLFTRFVSIADAYSALLMKRVYKPALSSEKAISLMSQNAENDFDLAIFHSFVQELTKSFQILDAVQTKGKIIDLDQLAHFKKY